MGARCVAVVGAGIAGLATALALRQRGVDAVVYERAPALREVGAGIALWPNATRALRTLGVLEAVAARSGPAARIRIVDPVGRTLLRFSTARPDAPSLCVRRWDLVGALAAALPESAVCYGAELVGVERQPGGVALRFADGREAEAEVVVGADGVRSSVRRYCNPDEPAYQGTTAWRAVGPRPREFEGDAFEAWGDGRRFGLFSLNGDAAYWYALANRPECEPRPESAHADLAGLFSGWHAAVSDTIQATPTGAIVRHDVYDRAASTAWGDGRVVLVGDAAHGMTPDLGQGGAFALEDAVALADALDGAGDLEAALAAFRASRRRRAAAVARGSRWAGRLGQLGGRAGRVRNAVARAVPSRWFEAAFTAPF